MVRRYAPREVQNFIWTPELAYVVGLIVTDGCLSKSGRHIAFTSKDIEQIGNFRLILRSKSSIGYTRNKKAEAYRITIR